MKVLFNTYPTAFQVPGGGEMQMLAYKKYLSELKINIDFFNQWQPSFENYDIVHFFSVYGGSMAFCEMVRSLHKPLFISSSLWITEDTKGLYPFDEISYQLSLANKIITNSNLEATQLSKVFNMQLDRFAVVHNGVDDHFFELGEKKFIENKIPKNTKFFLNIGNIETRKNQLALIKAMKKFPNYKLILIGHIRDKAYAEKCFSEGGEQIIYLGALKNTSDLLKSAMVACELFILPSILETPSISALEAASQGCKIVITSEGSTREYFQDDVEYVNPLSIDSIETGISKALIKNKSPDLRSRILSNYTWKKVADDLFAIYKKFTLE
jgi:glycosyltransferase involved in cell wall biosynthesis